MNVGVFREDIGFWGSYCSLFLMKDKNKKWVPLAAVMAGSIWCVCSIFLLGKSSRCLGWAMSTDSRNKRGRESGLAIPSFPFISSANTHAPKKKNSRSLI